ncbi:MAG: helix-turn-helix transcriptional regulator [Oscillospiraceae bacterium]|nr:helix-turn-helix transcriptional regulator [Oscillospiraceae bacterium]
MGSDFPQRLRMLRERRRMARKALSECCGLSKNVIARYERGERIPDIYTAQKIADFFDVTLDYLAGNEKNF